MNITFPAKSQVTALLIPLLAWLFFAVQHSLHMPLLNIVLIAALILCTLQAVHHAEVVAHRIGEPFGTLVLALAITFIEVSLIISMILAGGPEISVLARDTVFAAVMIILTGMIGLSLFTGGFKFKEQTFVLEGVNATLTTLVTISVLTLILPNFTYSISGPYYTDKQLLFVALVSLILYGSFIFVQNIKHKEHFINDADFIETTSERPTKKSMIFSLILLLVCLGAVVALAESLAPDLNHLIDSASAPRSLVGVIIAMVVLLPEGLSAYKAAKSNQLQKSLNLSLGSALASIGLSIPIVSIFAILNHTKLTLGIDAHSTLLFALALFIVTMALRTGKTTILQGIILIVIFCVYIFTIIFP
jgi:Ca2+:H+ antiporter